MKKHWSEVLECSCGRRFRSASAEAVHRHNFPALCRRPKPRPKKMSDAEAALRAQFEVEGKGARE